MNAPFNDKISVDNAAGGPCLYKSGKDLSRVRKFGLSTISDIFDNALHDQFHNPLMRGDLRRIPHVLNGTTEL